MTALGSYEAISTALLVRLTVEEYRVNPEDAATSEVLKFSNWTLPITVTVYGNNETYTPTGQLLNITPSRNELRSSAGGVTITLSGIPNTSIAEIVNSKIKGSQVQIFRVLLNPLTGQPLTSLDSGNPVGRFLGIVNNFSLEEDYNIGQKTSTTTIVLECASSLELLSTKVQGRRTNPEDMEYFYPGDKSFSRVPSLVDANFDFGDAT